MEINLGQSCNIIIIAMKELKQILIDRITNILELKCVFEDSLQHRDSKYDYIVEQKKVERMRSLRENDLLMSMSNLSISNSATQQEIFSQSVEICGLYDSSFLKYKADPGDSSLRKLYVQFFNAHGFQDKALYINSLLQRDKSIGLSPALFFGWLAEWSKKIYCEILQKEIEKSFVTKEKSPKCLTNSFTLGLLENKSKKLQKCFVQTNNSELSEISLSNRPNIQSFFIDQLQVYYKLTGMEGVDSSYLKTIRKRFQREEFLKPQNLMKAVNTLIECSANKQISNIMKNYESDYSMKFPKQIRQVVSSKICDNTKKVISFYPIKRKPRIITESDQTTNTNQSRFFSPKFSELEFMPEDQENKFKRIKIISHFKSIRNNFEFPGISWKKDTKFVQLGPDKNMFKTTKNRQQVIASLESRLKQKDFLKCESILSKYKIKDDPQLFSPKVFSSQLCTPIKQKRLDILSSDFDEKKIKIAKIFELADLKINKKFNTRNKSLVQQLM